MFGNVTYAELNTAFRQQTGFELAMNLPGKIDYIARLVTDQPGTLLLCFAFALFAVPRLRLLPRTSSRASVVVWLSTLTLPFLLAAALAPTPTFFQYYYALVPLLVLGIVGGLADATWQPDPARTSTRFLALALVASAVYVAPHYRSLVTTRASEWPVLAVQSIGQQIDEAARPGRILTLAPLLAQEGGRGIYPSLATGPFAWRVADLVPDEQRARFNVVAEAELPALLASDPPGGVLVGYEGQLEEPLIDYARANGFREIRLNGDATLWVPP
jgi:hypothetical protein